MTSINYDGRRFRSVANSPNGEVSGDTVFDYRQVGTVLSGTYSGGTIVAGQLLGTVADDGGIEMRYHHVGDDGELRAGRCTSTAQLLPDGRVRLHESWQWFSGDQSRGTSVVEEIPSDSSNAAED